MLFLGSVAFVGGEKCVPAQFRGGKRVYMCENIASEVSVEANTWRI